MPFPVSHTITGLIFANVLPNSKRPYWYSDLWLVALLANFPDFDFGLVWLTGDLSWHRAFSHSLPMALILGTIACLICYKTIDWKLSLSLALVTFSHGVLDIFTSSSPPNNGVMVFWPFWSKRFSANFMLYPFHNWRVYKGFELALKMLLVAGLEMLIYLPILVLFLCLRQFITNRFNKIA
jgi:membrane-bound metal-dependent hydrolase YbcI (DUF457 family)